VKSRAVAAVALLALATACSGKGGEGRTVVASFYPLAYAAERIAGPGWEVIDLTPPGTEAHDVELSLEDRAAIQDADVVVYLGQTGFQPQVERAVQDAEGFVIDVSALLRDVHLKRDVDLGHDPHFWLDPAHLGAVVLAMAHDLRGVIDIADPRIQAARQDLDGLHFELRTRLNDCRYRTIIVPHEAFGYLGDRYGFRQFGLAGVTPEGEPTASRLAEARQLIEEGSAGAVFYEAADDDSRRTAESLASDSGVPALPLSTLESEPPSGDYVSVMEDNLDSLREGLGCE
jgi:zinc transport system substrate-binding protein